MNLTTKKALTDHDIKEGLRLVIIDGLTAEVIITLTSGAFLVAMALLIGATNTQIGILNSGDQSFHNQYRVKAGAKGRTKFGKLKTTWSSVLSGRAFGQTSAIIL